MVRVVAQMVEGDTRIHIEYIPRDKIDEWTQRTFGCNDAYLEIDGKMGFIYHGLEDSRT